MLGKPSGPDKPVNETCFDYRRGAQCLDRSLAVWPSGSTSAGHTMVSGKADFIFALAGFAVMCI